MVQSRRTDDKDTTFVFAIMLHLCIFAQNVTSGMRFLSNHLDFFGFSASFLCAIHCMAMPLILSLGLAGGLPWLENPFLEWGLILSTFLIAGWSLVRSIAQHGQYKPLLIAIIGFIIILAVHFLEGSLEHYLAAIGGSAIAYAHYVNWRMLGCVVKSH